MSVSFPETTSILHKDIISLLVNLKTNSLISFEYHFIFICSNSKRFFHLYSLSSWYASQTAFCRRWLPSSFNLVYSCISSRPHSIHRSCFFVTKSITLSNQKWRHSDVTHEQFHETESVVDDAGVSASTACALTGQTKRSRKT